MASRNPDDHEITRDEFMSAVGGGLFLRGAAARSAGAASRRSRGMVLSRRGDRRMRFRHRRDPHLSLPWEGRTQYWQTPA